MPLGGGSEEKGDYVGRDLPWWVSDWVPQPWGLTQGRQAPLAGSRTTETNKRTVGSLDSPREEHKHLLAPEAGCTGQIQNKGWLTHFQWPSCTPQPEPSFNTPALFSSFDISTPEWGQPWLRKKSCPWDAVVAQILSSIWAGWGQRYWQLHRWRFRCRVDISRWPDGHSLCPDPCWIPTPAPIASALLPSGLRLLAVMRGRACS